MADRKAFNFYFSYWAQMKLLNDKQKLDLFKAICKVQFLEVNILDIVFKDDITELVWTGIKHSVSTSLNGFISKNKGLENTLMAPLTAPLGKGGAQQVQEEGEEEEEGKGKEEGKEEGKEYISVWEKFPYKKEFKKVLNLFEEKFRPTTPTQKIDWLDVFEKSVRLDKYQPEKIVELVEWAREDDFWKSNLMSFASFRKKGSSGIKKVDSINAKFSPKKSEKPEEEEPDYSVTKIE